MEYLIKHYFLMNPWHLILLSVIFVGAGINHFRIPSFYEKMIPPYWKYPKFWNYLSGLMEIAAGILLLNHVYQVMAASLIFTMLILFFSVHIYMLQERHGKFKKIPEWILWARIPLQFFLLYWASMYIRMV